jgi:hypothetical protein
VVLGFELRALYLLGRHTTTSATPPALEILLYIKEKSKVKI